MEYIKNIFDRIYKLSVKQYYRGNWFTADDGQIIYKPFSHYWNQSNIYKDKQKCFILCNKPKCILCPKTKTPVLTTFHSGLCQIAKTQIKKTVRRPRQKCGSHIIKLERAARTDIRQSGRDKAYRRPNLWAADRVDFPQQWRKQKRRHQIR